MFKSVFYRNVQARDLLDAFLVSAITSLLAVRFYLHLADYPQISPGSLHIAHMLWGGLLMMAAIVILLSFLGSRAKALAAVIGGVGFGVFIDELGKFITDDNDYFFRPAVGIIYALFVVIYLCFNFLTRSQKLTEKEYNLNALAELEEAVAHDLDKSERNKIYALLDAGNKNGDITKNLRRFVDTLELTGQEKRSFVDKQLKRIENHYRGFWKKQGSNRLIRVLFIFEAIILAAVVVYTIFSNIGEINTFFDGQPTYDQELLAGQIISAVFAAAFVVYGIAKLPYSRIVAFEQFRRGTLINIYLTHFFLFVRVEFEALPGLFLNLVLLLVISYVIHQETIMGAKKYG